MIRTIALGVSVFATCTATTALFAEENATTLVERINVVLQRANPEECTKPSTFAINQGTVSLNSCIYVCVGEWQEAKLTELDFEKSVKTAKEPLQDGFSAIEVPCRSGRRCVSTITNAFVGYKQGPGCQQFSDIQGGRDGLLFVVQSARAESLLLNLRQVR